jgi:hypothetical protein
MSLVNPEELQKKEIEYIKNLEIKKHFNDMLIGIESIIYYRDLDNNQDIINIINTAFCIDEKNDVKQVLKTIYDFKQIIRGNKHTGVFKKFDKIIENEIIITSDLYEFTGLIYFLINFTTSILIFMLKMNNINCHENFKKLIENSLKSCINLYDNLFKLHTFVKDRKLFEKYQSTAKSMYEREELKTINMNEYIEELNKYIIKTFIVTNEINEIKKFIMYIKNIFIGYCFINNKILSIKDKINENITRELLENFFDIISQNINNLNKNKQLIEILNNLVYLIKYLNNKYLIKYYSNNFLIILYGIEIYISIQKLIEYLHNSNYIIIYNIISPIYIKVTKDKIVNYLSHEDQSEHDLNSELSNFINIHMEISNFIDNSSSSLKSSSLKAPSSLKSSSLKAPSSLKSSSLKSSLSLSSSLKSSSSLKEPSRQLILREQPVLFNKNRIEGLNFSTITFNISDNIEYIKFVNFVKLQVLNYLFESYKLGNLYFEGFHDYLGMNNGENIENSKLVINLIKLFKIINKPVKITEDINNFISEIINLIININLIFHYNNNNNKIIILYGIYCITLLKTLVNNEKKQTIIYTQFTYNPKLQLTSYLVNFINEIFKYDFNKDVRNNKSSDIYSNISICIIAINDGYYIYDDTIIAVDKIKSPVLNDDAKFKEKSIIETIQFNIADTSEYMKFVNFIKLTVLEYLSVLSVFNVNVDTDNTLKNISKLFDIIIEEKINADIKSLVSEIIKLIVNINLSLYYNNEKDIKNILMGVHCINLLKTLMNENESGTIIYYKYNYDYKTSNNELLKFINDDYNYNFNTDIKKVKKINIYENIELQIILINTNPIFNIKKSSSLKQQSIKLNSEDIIIANVNNPESIYIFIRILKTYILNYLYEVIYDVKNERLNSILLEYIDEQYTNLNYIKHIQKLFDIIEKKIGNKNSINYPYTYLLHNINLLITNIIYLLSNNITLNIIIILKGIECIILLNKLNDYLANNTNIITYKYYNYNNDTVQERDNFKKIIENDFAQDLEKVIKEKQSITNEDNIYINIDSQINAINGNYTYNENNIEFNVNGGANKYKKTDKKITVIYKKKEYTRVIYICERKKYVKINKTFMLLSKLKKFKKG